MRRRFLSLSSCYSSFSVRYSCIRSSATRPCWLFRSGVFGTAIRGRLWLCDTPSCVLLKRHIRHRRPLTPQSSCQHGALRVIHHPGATIAILDFNRRRSDRSKIGNELSLQKLREGPWWERITYVFNYLDAFLNGLGDGIVTVGTYERPPSIRTHAAWVGKTYMTTTYSACLQQRPSELPVVQIA